MKTRPIEMAFHVLVDKRLLNIVSSILLHPYQLDKQQQLSIHLNKVYPSTFDNLKLYIR